MERRKAFDSRNRLAWRRGLCNSKWCLVGVNHAVHLREREWQITVHHVSKHAGNGQALCILLGQETHHAIDHVTRGE